MTRRIAGSAVAMLLSLLILTVCMWVRSVMLGLTDSFTWNSAGVHRCLEFSSASASVHLNVCVDPALHAAPLAWHPSSQLWNVVTILTSAPSPNQSSSFAITHIGGPDDPHLDIPGFKYQLMRGYWRDGNLHSFQCSYYMLMLATGIIPFAWLLRRGWQKWKQSRLLPGHCHVCGYDLHATPQRCPECGATPLPSQIVLIPDATP